ncbi:MAG: ABC transporter permease [Spirochaetales bacterium]|nr:ABC transporter permease [Spirochaetales bacterium]
MKRFFAIFMARNLEFIRDKATFIWTLLLPAFLIFGFAFAFSGTNNAVYKIGTVGEKPAGKAFLSYRHLQFISYPSGEEALNKLKHHQVDMVLDFDAGNYYINNDDTNGYIAEKLLASDLDLKLKRKTVTGTVIRYIDWFVPGVIGMNIMFSCLMGVGFVIVRYRKNGVLKRFKATPLRSIEFITAQLISRFLIVIFTSIVIYTGTNIFLHFEMSGSYTDLFLVTSLAILCHISLGLLFSTRFKSEEVAGGIINIVIWPMMFLSGIFFSLEGTPPAMQVASRLFPITHFIEAARKIMLDGAGLSGVTVSILVLTAATIIFLVASAVLFKWE